MRYAFTFHIVAWLAGIPDGAYVHYPTISTDMLARVEARSTTYANSSTISSSTALSHVKLIPTEGQRPEGVYRCKFSHFLTIEFPVLQKIGFYFL
ncbi:hypothetical protein BJV77DRAFT_243413 [Russula vinacea]|jgi:hypothetical protein|nr:hypothetical protein BJV77DRAFT_302717 [Russula vinacea]KAH9983774.1 hypothetical protein BJV77DRAFT_243413 [Russula vinacea]